MNIREMCETISKTEILKGNPTAKEVFEYSQTGELSMIWEWYLIAEMISLQKDIQKEIDNHPKLPEKREVV